MVGRAAVPWGDGTLAQGLRRASDGVIPGVVPAESLLARPAVRIHGGFDAEALHERAHRACAARPAAHSKRPDVHGGREARIGLRIPQVLAVRSLPANDRRDVSASNAILRRFVRGELREQRTVWGCDHAGPDPRGGAPIPDYQETVRAGAERRLDWRMGIAGASGLSPRVLRRHVDIFPRSGRFSPLWVGRHLF